MLVNLLPGTNSGNWQAICKYENSENDTVSCRMQADVSFGNVGREGVVTAAQGGNIPTNALLASPTPQKPNTGPRPGGPLILR